MGMESIMPSFYFKMSDLRERTGVSHIYSDLVGGRFFELDAKWMGESTSLLNMARLGAWTEDLLWALCACDNGKGPDVAARFADACATRAAGYAAGGDPRTAPWCDSAIQAAEDARHAAFGARVSADTNAFADNQCAAKYAQKAALNAYGAAHYSAHYPFNAGDDPIASGERSWASGTSAGKAESRIQNRELIQMIS